MMRRQGRLLVEKGVAEKVVLEQMTSNNGDTKAREDGNAKASSEMRPHTGSRPRARPESAGRARQGKAPRTGRE